jgi:hypothetical protein
MPMFGLTGANLIPQEFLITNNASIARETADV